MEKFLSIKIEGHEWVNAFKVEPKTNPSSPDYKGYGVGVWKEPNNILRISMPGHNDIQAIFNPAKQGNQPDFDGPGVGVWIKEKKDAKPQANNCPI